MIQNQNGLMSRNSSCGFNPPKKSCLSTLIFFLATLRPTRTLKTPVFQHVGISCRDDYQQRRRLELPKKIQHTCLHTCQCYREVKMRQTNNIYIIIHNSLCDTATCPAGSFSWQGFQERNHVSNQMYRYIYLCL